MKKAKIFILFFGIVAAALFIYFVLQNEKTLLVHPKGIMARSELDLIITQISYMLIIIVPTLVAFFWVAWRYNENNSKKNIEGKPTRDTFKQILLWIIPSIIVAVMIVALWRATHELDPYKSLQSDKKPLQIQVVAMEWKWLFIYPEQGIASVNFVEFPEKTPVQFSLAADNTPMNSFWLPQLSGQIYAMTGMVTPLQIMADEPGDFTGRAAEINGKGFAGMTFAAKSVTENDFDAWVAQVKKEPLELTAKFYEELLEPSISHPIQLYSNVEKDLFNNIVMKYMHHAQ